MTHTTHTTQHNSHVQVNRTKSVTTVSINDHDVLIMIEGSSDPEKSFRDIVQHIKDIEDGTIEHIFNAPKKNPAHYPLNS